jgi:SAM-dependent methyltransferase
MDAADADAIAVVVPGGFGGFFQQQLRGCDHILAGAQQGEAAVDILLISNGDTIEWLRTADDAPPVVAVMAVVAWSESASSEHDLAAEVEGSKSWDTALRLFRQWREPGFGAEEAPSFRVTALRDKALAQPRVNDVARAVAGGIHRRWGWPVSMTNYVLEVCALWLGRGVALAGLPLTPGWHACERTSKGCFFPAECRLTQTANGGAYDHAQPRLRPSACHGLLLAASLQRCELLLDPMCGVGSIPAEALRRFGASFVLGGDSCAHAVKDAARCVRASGLDTAHWDVRQLPLRSGVADRLVVDMPWGNRGKGTLNQATLHAALVEIGRVLTEGGTAVLLLLRAAAARISRLDCRPLRLLDVHLVSVGGWPVAIARLQKASAAHAAAQDDTKAAGDATPDASTQQLSPAPSLPPPPEQPLALPQPLVPSLCSASTSVSRCCGAVRVSEGHVAYPLGELLVAALPSLVRSISNARRIVSHRRVCLESHPGRRLHWQSKVGIGEVLIVRPHTAKYLPLETLRAYYAKEPLTVLWETCEWLAVLKPSSSVGVLHGSRSLANSIIGLQCERQRARQQHEMRHEAVAFEPAAMPKDTTPEAPAAVPQPAFVAEPATELATCALAEEAPPDETDETDERAEKAPPDETDETDERAEEAPPWSVGYDGDARVGGAWLVAKTPRAALALLLQPSMAQLEWRAVFRGAPAVGTMESWGLTAVQLVRTGRSVRFVQMTEASFRTSGPEMSVWRSAAAAAGHPVIGDSADCCDPHSKSACLWVCDVHIERSADSSSGVSVPGALPPARFDRLFEREEQVADQAARGVLKPEYLRSLLKLRPCT